MVLLTALVALITAQAADEPTLRPWGLDHVGVSVLPVPAHPLAGQVGSAVSKAMEPGVVLVPLSPTATERLVSQPACRERPRCLAEVLHPGLGYTLDVRVEGTGADTRVLVRLLKQGVETDRRSVYCRPDRVARTVTAEVQELMRPLQLDFRFYERAVAGDEKAGQTLRNRYPDSPWAKKAR